MVFHVIQLFAQWIKHDAHCEMAINTLASTDVSADKGPRSGSMNTEMGPLIGSSQLAGLLNKSVSTALPWNAWINGLGAIEGPF
jgi:hypothetical protein